MSRLVPALLAGLFVAGSASSADGPAGNWKLSLNGGQLIFLIKLEEKAGKWSGQLLDVSRPNLPKVTVNDVSVTADRLKLALRIESEELSFDGKLPADAKTGKVAGSLQVGPGQSLLLNLEPSKLKAYDKFDFAKES